MASATLVRDKDSNLKAVGFRKVSQSMEYELAFPYKNEDLGDSLWQLGKAYQIAILVGSAERFNGVTEDTWMSDQVYIRLGSRSQDSIYQPPYLAGPDTTNHHEYSHGGEDGQKEK
jgi:hypothetical protein